MSDTPECGVIHSRIPRDRWPASLLEAVTEDWLLELQELRQHGAHQLALIDVRSTQRPAELAFDHDDAAGVLHVGRVYVDPHWRAHGLARGLYDLLHDLRPDAVVVHTELSAHGQRLVAALPPGWNRVRPRMLEPLPRDCTGAMIDPGGPDDVLLVHATDWCPVHECDCGTAEEQDLLDDQEELLDLHLDGEPFDPWWPHEQWCGVRQHLPRQGLSVLCACWHTCPGEPCDDEQHTDGPPSPVPSPALLSASWNNSPAAVATLLRDLATTTQHLAMTEWVTHLRQQAGTPGLGKVTGPVAPEDTWTRFVASDLPVEAGALPGCVTHPNQWGQRIEDLFAVTTPEHGYVPGCCSVAAQGSARTCLR